MIRQKPPLVLIFQVLFSRQTHYHLCLLLWNLSFFLCQKSWFLRQRWKSLKRHTKNVNRSPYSELCRISTIQHLLFVDSAKTLVSVFVLCRLDYCNSLLSGCPKRLEKLQKVQNSAARLVLKVHKRDHVSSFLTVLHWSPQRGAMDTEIEVPSDENTELKGSHL